MNRIDELTFRLLQADLSPTEQAELESLLAHDAQARRCHVELLRLEAALVGAGRPADVAETTVTHLKSFATAGLEQAVMQTIATLPVPPWGPSATIESAKYRLRFRHVLAVGTACAAVLLMVAFVRWSPHEPQNLWDGPRADANILAEASAMIVRLDAAVHVDGVDATVGQQVKPGQTINTPDDGLAVLQYADGTQLELYRQTRVRLETEPNRAKRLLLHEGGLHAHVKPQPNDRPLVVVTPHTELRVMGTTFAVTSFEDEGTRVDLESGQVELTSHQLPTVQLVPGSTAHIMPGQMPTVVPAAAAAPIQPTSEVDLRGLKMVGFWPDGRTILAASNWQAAYWKDANTFEAVPISPESRRSREGILIHCLAGPMLAFTDRKQPKMVVWDSRTRRSVFTRELPETLDQLAAVSPRGDWLATWETIERTKNLRLWRADAEAPIVATTITKKTTGVGSSADGRILAVARSRQAIDLLETTTGRVLGELPMKQKVPMDLAFSSDDRLLAVAVVGKVELWHVQRQELLATFTQPGLPMLHVAISQDGKRMAATSIDDRVWLWNVAQPDQPTVLRLSRRVVDVAFAPDGASLAVLSQEGRLSWWELPE